MAMLASSSRSLRCLCSGVRTLATAADRVPAASTSYTAPGQEETWKPAIPKGQSALYDLALDVLQKGKQKQLDELREEKQNSSKTQDELDLLEAEAHSRDPEILWNFDHGLADYTKPAYRYLRERRWRRSGDLALVMKKMKDDLIIPDLLPTLEPTVEMIVSLESAGVAGVLPGRPLLAAQTLSPPVIQAFVPHAEARLYTLALIDPDAPDEEHVSFQEKWHWLRVNVSLSPTRQDPTSSGDEILPYLPPHPQRGTPKHRYVLVLAEQKGPIDESEPYQRNGQLLWRSYLERHEARTASAFHWVCRHTNNNHTAISMIYRKYLGEREPVYSRRYRVNKYRLYGSVGRSRHDI